MPLDAAHMSERTTADVFALAEANGFYPVCVDTKGFESSAELTIRMWERAESDAREGPASDADDLDVSGIVRAPDKAARQSAMPSVCNTPYCPESRALGEACSFTEECKEGRCNSGLCGVPAGVCVP